MLDLRRVLGWNTDLELKESEYRRPMRIRSGELEMERDSAIGTVYEQAPAPVWTKDPPSTPGTWWVRVPGHQRKVVEGYRRNGELWLRLSDVPAAKVPRTALEWGSRPIVSPVEPR